MLNKALILFTVLFSNSLLSNEIASRDKTKLVYEFTNYDFKKIKSIVLKRIIANRDYYNFQKSLSPCSIKADSSEVFFEDLYFDTFNSQLLNTNSSLRLRRFYSSYFNWWLKGIFSPYKAEIQLHRIISHKPASSNQIYEMNMDIDLEKIKSEINIQELGAQFKKELEVLTLGEELTPVFSTLNKSSQIKIDCPNPWASPRIFTVTIKNQISIESEEFKPIRTKFDVEIDIELSGAISNRLREFAILRNPTGDKAIKIAKEYSAQNLSHLKNDLGAMNRSIQILMLGTFKKRTGTLKSSYRRVRDSLTLK